MALTKCQVVLVDDQSKNTVVAREYGWHAIEFLNTRDSVDELRTKLIQIGVPLERRNELQDQLRQLLIGLADILKIIKIAS